MTCPCSDSPSKDGLILVIREDGNLLKFNNGVHAKDIMAANDGYKLVKCCSQRTVMPSSSELESKRLYFMVPETVATSPEMYEKMCVAKGLVQMKRDVHGSSSGGSNDGNEGDNVCEFRRSCSWTPQLKTIPEITSPPGVLGS
ncbi:hypothetical protein DsansV1_C04g0042921 [Dioscorea sansibarensis]